VPPTSTLPLALSVGHGCRVLDFLHATYPRYSKPVPTRDGPIEDGPFHARDRRGPPFWQRICRRCQGSITRCAPSSAQLGMLVEQIGDDSQVPGVARIAAVGFG
jgi:hypothetical protein